MSIKVCMCLYFFLTTQNTVGDAFSNKMGISLKKVKIARVLKQCVRNCRDLLMTYLY